MNAQNSTDRENIKRQTNQQALQKIIDRSNQLEKANKTKTNRQKIPLTKTTKDGRLGVIFGFDEKGEPVYAYDDNTAAAATGRTDKIWQGGSTGLDLTGAGIEIAVWESGYARPTHVEFGGRASNGGDGGSVTSHGTHTGGTLIATGIDAAARGMASGATIKNYTATNMVSETAVFAAAGGILANNSNTPSGTSGNYNAVARDMDDVLYNAPFYLQCKSAGNDGNTYGVIRSTQLSKNLLVVGNTVDVPNYTGPSSVSMWTTSSYGPTNDWRIKPDISNNGRSVYSSDNANDTDYGTKTGTSMSTPATTGTLALLQQHYKNLNGVYMRAATAKALLINTADEVGANDGPDFASGWGLVNAERAAQVISNNGTSSIMDELTLNNGGTYTRTIVSDGSTPLSLNIVWNDPGGATGTGTAPILINDLDVRVTGNGNTYSPWVMVPNGSFNNYTDPAQRGDNFRDNVEKIDAVLAPGTYTVTVTHKGTLTNGSQDFSLIITGVNVNVVPDNETPSIPTNLTASNTTSSSTDLSWAASTDNIGVTVYEVFQGNTSIGSSTTTSFNVTGLTASTSYSFTVQAKDAAGNTSGSSTAVNVTTTAPPPCSGIANFPYSESFESGVGVWVQESTDDLDWVVDSAGIPSNNTGPTAANDGTNYIYTEATGNGTGFPNKVALLTSPCIDLSNQLNAKLSFDYHMFGAAMGVLEMRASTDDGSTWTTIWSLSGDQGNSWNSQTVSLAAYSGSVIKLQIKGTTGSDFTSDMTIDNLSIISSVPDNEAPSVPTNLTASNTSSNSTDLSWTASTDNIGVTGYEIFQDGTSIGTSTTTNYNVSGLSAETSYSFTVQAKDAGGNTSGSSTAVNVTTTSTPAQLFTVGITTVGTSTSTHADRRAMSYTMPENGTLQSIAIHITGGSGDMQLGVYADNNGVPSNKLGQTTVASANATTGWQTIALENPIIIGNGDTIWLAWMLSTNPGVAYVSGNPGRYSASGTTWSTSGNNMPSSYGSGSQADFRYSIYANYTQFVDTQAPSVPTNLTASNIRNTSVDLNWTASTDDIGVVGYDVYQGTTVIGSSTTTDYGVSGLTANTSYSFSVRAKDAAGNISANSIATTVTTTNVVQYALTTNTVGQGTVSGGGTYNSGEVASVTATPASGWEFGGWTGDLSGNANPGSLTMDADKTVTATFTEVISVSTSTEKYRLTWRENPSTTMVIGWNQVRGTNPVVHYGPKDFGLNYSSYPLSKTVDRTVSSKGMDNRYARLTGLQPNTAYYFVIKDSEGVSERYWFKTAPNDPTIRLSIVAGGDSRNNRTPRQNANRLVAKIRPHAVLFGGDMTSSSSSSQWQNWFNDWQLTIGSDGRMIPVVAARGNHESSNDIRDLFDIPTAAGGEFYALSFGGNLMRTYTLNTEVTPAGTQGSWLANDLAANSASHTWAVAQYHRSTRPHEPGKSEQNDQYEAWSKPFYTHAVQLVMESDSHVVKRTWPIKPSTGTGSDEGFIRVDNDPKRAVYVGEGCWGAPLRNASDTKNWTRAAGSFNQFKWLWVDQNQIIMRTIKVDNATSVGQVNDNDLFSLPANIDVWNPSGGSVVTINNPHNLAVRSAITTNNSTTKSSEFDLSAYPNPIESGLLHIVYPNYAKVQEPKAIIRDMFGKVVHEINIKSKTEMYNIDKLNAGVYFISIKVGNRKISTKFVKK
ncbi:fibronectin type III domain-containing protein [Aquimarina mytili]|nr:fibronectin type III domain-containing protein [Aquimarina mytili]